MDSSEKHVDNVSPIDHANANTTVNGTQNMEIFKNDENVDETNPIKLCDNDTHDCMKNDNLDKDDSGHCPSPCGSGAGSLLEQPPEYEALQPKSTFSVEEDNAEGNSESVTEPPDGGCRAWLVCLASFYAFGAVFAVLNTFGIIYVELMKEFEDDGGDIAFKTAWIGSLHLSLTFITSLFVGILVDKLGLRLVSSIGVVLSTAGMVASSFVTSLGLMYFTYGVLMGVGCSLVFIPASVILSHYFKKKLGIVNGIVAFGSAAFTIANAFAMPVILKAVGMRNTMRVEAGMMALLFLCPIIWKPILVTRLAVNSDDNKRKGCSTICRSIFNVDIWRNRNFVIWCVSVAFSSLGYFIPFTHLVNYSKQQFPDSPGQVLVVCVGGVTGISRLILGKLSDHPKINRVWILQISLLLLGLATTFISLAPNFGILVFITVLMGICDGGFISMVNPIAYDLLGPEGVTQGIGAVWGLIGVPVTAGPPLAGLMLDKMGTYELVFRIGAMPAMIGPLAMFLMSPTINAEQKVIADETEEILEKKEI